MHTFNNHFFSLHDPIVIVNFIKIPLIINLSYSIMSSLSSSLMRGMLSISSNALYFTLMCPLDEEGVTLGRNAIRCLVN